MIPGETRAKGSVNILGDVCFEAHSGLKSDIAALPKCANTGSPAASLWKSCFAETVDKHLSLPLTATSYPFRYSEIGLNRKELGHRLPGFCILPDHIAPDGGADI